MKMTIEAGQYGWVVSIATDECNMMYPIEIQDDESDSAAFLRLLHLVNAEMGPSTSRYDKERVCIDLEAGDKYADGIKSGLEEGIALSDRGIALSDRAAKALALEVTLDSFIANNADLLAEIKEHNEGSE